MGTFKKYDKIPGLHRSEAQEIFNIDEVIIQEKLDGMNASVGLVNGTPSIHSRNNLLWCRKPNARGGYDCNHNKDYDGFNVARHFHEQYNGSPDAMNAKLEEYDFFDKLQSYFGDNVLVFGEFYGQGIQNRVNYGPHRYFTFFDVFVGNKEQGGNWLSHDDFVAFCEALELPMVPELYRGPPSLPMFDKKLVQSSVQAMRNGVVDNNNTHEGIVVKGVYGETNLWGDRIITKYKPEKFAEKENKKIKTNKTNKDPSGYNQTLVQQYVTQSRLHNILEKMRGENKPAVIKNTGEVVQRMTEDVLEEMEPSEKEHQDFNERHFRKMVGGQTAQLFKSYLKTMIGR